MKQNNKDQRTMDVAKPGKSLPDASSRPIIVSSHSTIMKDPMVRSQTDKATEGQADENTKEEPLVYKGGKVISPINNEPKDDDNEAEDAAIDDTKADQTDEDKASKNNEAAVVGAVIDKVQNSSKKQEEMDAKEAADKQTHLDKLVADKKYFVSIGQVARRKNKRVAVLLIILLIVVSAGYYVIKSKVFSK